MEFREWFRELQRVATASGSSGSLLDPLDWADDWSDGLSPREAWDFVDKIEVREARREQSDADKS